ncbi:cytochrome P450 55A3 [Apiospora arundinis]
MSGQPFAQGSIHAIPAKGYQHPVLGFLEQGPSFPDPHSDSALIYVTSRSTPTSSGIRSQDATHLSKTSKQSQLAIKGAKLPRANLEHLVTLPTASAALLVLIQRQDS